MARVSKCDKLAEHDRLRLVGRIGEGASWRDLAAEFSLPAETIRQWSERNGYGRSSTESKRKMVADLLAKPETGQQTGQQTGQDTQTGQRTVSTGNPDVDAAAQEDARDMRLGLTAARLALQVSAMGLKEQKDTGNADPRATKLWSECVALNVNTIRKIRGLDDAKTETSTDLAAAADAFRRKHGI